MHIALLQLNVSDDPNANLPVLLDQIRSAASDGATFILTPEVTNCISTSRKHQNSVLRHEADDPTLAAVKELCTELKVWVLIGSLALKTDDSDGRFANRSFLIDPEGAIAAWYDKIHMFDVTISKTEQYHESKGYRPGDKAVVADMGLAKIGMTICYDVRFPHLYRDLALAGAQIITVPAAFSPVTGAAHWEALLRARAIETGCYILAPAQTGDHGTRKTYGHSLVVDPWGGIIAKAGIRPGVVHATLDLQEIDKARQRVPSLRHSLPYSSPHDDT